jgi:hypothetical protein
MKSYVVVPSLTGPPSYTHPLMNNNPSLSYIAPKPYNQPALRMVNILIIELVYQGRVLAIIPSRPVQFFFFTK